jgi:hypothetical protein
VLTDISVSTEISVELVTNMNKYVSIALMVAVGALVGVAVKGYTARPKAS